MKFIAIMLLSLLVAGWFVLALWFCPRWSAGQEPGDDEQLLEHCSLR